MKYMIFSMLVLGLSIVIGILITTFINSRKKMKRPARAVITIIFSAGFFLAAGLVYLNTYYHAEDKALDYLNSSAEVEVVQTDKGYMFDGPGKESALVFYPGAKVDEKAYASLMHYIAERGIDCFLIKMPFRIAFFGSGAADDIMNEYDYDKWFIAGHSLGGSAASAYTDEEHDKVRGTVLLASYPLSEQRDNASLLSIYGSEDEVLDLKAYKESRSLWPEDSYEYIIKGGSHAGFGLYGAQSGDGTASISQEDQQIQTAELIVQWINER